MSKSVIRHHHYISETTRCVDENGNCIDLNNVTFEGLPRTQTDVNANQDEGDTDLTEWNNTSNGQDVSEANIGKAAEEDESDSPIRGEKSKTPSRTHQQHNDEDTEGGHGDGNATGGSSETTDGERRKEGAMRQRADASEYEDDERTIQMRVDAVEDMILGNGNAGWSFNMAKMMPHQSKDCYSKKQYTHLIHVVMQEMIDVAERDRQFDNKAIPSAESISRAAAKVRELCAARLEEQQDTDLASKLGQRKHYHIKLMKAKKEPQKENRARSKVRFNRGGVAVRALQVMKGDVDSLPKRPVNAQDILTNSPTAPSNLFRDLNGVTSPRSRTVGDIDRAVHYFGGRKIKDYTETDIRVMCEEWAEIHEYLRTTDARQALYDRRAPIVQCPHVYDLYATILFNVKMSVGARKPFYIRMKTFAVVWDNLFLNTDTACVKHTKAIMEEYSSVDLPREIKLLLLTSGEYKQIHRVKHKLNLN